MSEDCWLLELCTGRPDRGAGGRAATGPSVQSSPRGAPCTALLVALSNDGPPVTLVFVALKAKSG
jgi:hypothetical protein